MPVAAARHGIASDFRVVADGLLGGAAPALRKLHLDATSLGDAGAAALAAAFRAGGAPRLAELSLASNGLSAVGVAALSSCLGDTSLAALELLDLSVNELAVAGAGALALGLRAAPPGSLALRSLRIPIVTLYAHALLADLAMAPACSMARSASCLCAQLSTQLDWARLRLHTVAQLIATLHRLFIAGPSINLVLAARLGQAEELKLTAVLANHVLPARSEQVDRASFPSRPLEADRINRSGAEPQAEGAHVRGDAAQNGNCPKLVS